jgi:hypothetical protein
LRSLDYVQTVRSEFKDLLSLGQLPGADALTEQEVESYAASLRHLPDAPTAAEAAALVGLLPPDETTAFGLAWTLVHSIESSPEWPVWDVLTDDGWWRSVLRDRAAGRA